MSVTSKSSSSARPVATANKASNTDKLEKEIVALRADLAALAKKCADLEGRIGKSSGNVDTDNFVTKHEFSIFKGKVSKKVGLKR